MRLLRSLAVAPALVLAACASATPTSQPNRSGTSLPATSAALKPCAHINVADLSAVATPVQLDRLRSTPSPQVSGVTSVTCVFANPGRSGQVGSITLITYPSASAAATAIRSGVSAAQGVGLPIVALDKAGVQSYAEQVPDGWTCAVVSGPLATEATLATASSPAACAWGQAGLAALEAPG